MIQAFMFLYICINLNKVLDRAGNSDNSQMTFLVKDDENHIVDQKVPLNDTDLIFFVNVYDQS